MTRRWLAPTLAAIIAATGLLAGPAQAVDAAPAAAVPLPVPPVCDRACLEGMIDAYLQAMVAHDPSKLPLTADARFTENGSELKLGDGLWGTVTKIGPYRHYFTDPKTGEVGFLGDVEEQGTPALFALRLKVAGRRIVEAETIVAQAGHGLLPQHEPDPEADLAGGDAARPAPAAGGAGPPHQPLLRGA